MITRKIILAVLLTFCFTAVLFTIAPTRTATTINSTATPSSTVTSTGTYDPWVDVNHDGHINVLDLIKVAASLNSNGNPALNVTVTNMPTEKDTLVWYKAFLDSSTQLLTSPTYSLKGYSHVNFALKAAFQPGVNDMNTVSVDIVSQVWNAQKSDYDDIHTVYALTANKTTLTISMPVYTENFLIRAYTGGNPYNVYVWEQITVSFYAANS